MLLNMLLLNYDLNFLLQETIKLQNMKRSKARVKKPPLLYKRILYVLQLNVHSYSICVHSKKTEK